MTEFAGCWYLPIATQWWQKTYLPCAQSSFHTSILSDMQQTVLSQTFKNSSNHHIKTCKYSFPLYDGVSVTGFKCEFSGRKLIGTVKEKVAAKREFDAAVSQGRKAGLMEQSSAADVFSTSLGHVGPGEEVHVTITYIGELKNDFDIDGIRLTIPTRIAPRYGDLPAGDTALSSNLASAKAINITIDVVMPKDKPISGLESPSHPVSISLGKLSTDAIDNEPSFSRASATLSEQSDGLDRDFVLLIKAKDTGSPTAVLQTHPTLKNHRVLMTSLVPKFALPSIRPEIVFVADRSGSMDGNIPMLKQAMKVFLKSLPAGVKFNICSFGSSHDFLWPKSQSYTEDSLKKANKHVDTFDANYGGTETLGALEATIKNRYKDIPLEIILLTDGDIWGQEQAFASMNKAVADSNNQIRLFPLGIGDGVSHSLIEGLARAGNGFAQAVQLNERIDTRVIRMLKGALTPHISDYTLEVKYENDDDFELIDAVQENLKLDEPGAAKSEKGGIVKSVISLFNKDANPDSMDTSEDKTIPIPELRTPKLLQAPQTIPSLYSFSRTTVYLLMSPDTVQRNPTSVILKANSEHGPLRLEIPVTILETPSEAISQLAARKAVQDLEESRGWVYHAKDATGKKIMDLYPSRAEEIVKREAVRLGTTYQIANKWCSFIAVEAKSAEASKITHETAPPGYTERETELVRKNFTSSTLRRRAGSSPSAAGEDLKCEISNVDMIDSSDEDMEFALVDEDEAGPPEPVADYYSAPPPGGAAPAALYKPAAPRSQILQLPISALPPPPAPSTAAPSRKKMAFGGAATDGAAMRFRSVGGRGGLSSESKAKSSGSGRGGGGIRKSFFSMGRSLSSQTPGSTADGSRAETSEKEENSLSDSDKVHTLISLQGFEGSWELSAELKRILGLSDAQIKAHSGKTWITVLTITFLKQTLAAEQEVWELVVDKAQEWLQQQNTDQKLFAEAEALFRA